MISVKWAAARRQRLNRMAAAGMALVAGLVVAGCGSGGAGHPDLTAPVLKVVAAENEYGDVAAQIGGRYVAVTSIISNPNTDPHTYEVDPRVAAAVAAAAVVIQNGLGYDSFLDPIESASASKGRTVIDAAHLLGRPDSTPNPHLWYDPATMPAVAASLAATLSRLQPAHAPYFRSALSRFDASLQPWRDALAASRAKYPGAPVATTEPVADYLLQAAGADDLTPFSFQADVMNGVDPAPQDLSFETALLEDRKVKALVYNQQVTDATTEGFVRAARAAGVAVVGVYETMPVPGFDYQSWMLAETTALDRAFATGQSASRL